MESEEGYSRHFDVCNRYREDHFGPFRVGGTVYGLIHNETTRFLLKHSPHFDASETGLTLKDQIISYAERSKAFAEAAHLLAHHRHKHLRQELYPLIGQWGEEAIAELDRSAVPWFGVPAFGVHLNGFVRKGVDLFLWIGERTAHRTADPGKLDNMVGGGLPKGLSVRDNLIKESREEADLPEALTRSAVFASTLRYRREWQNGLRNDTLFIFDLELPSHVIPRNTDGEVAAFHLMHVREVAEIIRSTTRFKFNCNLVIIDFLVRHGLLHTSEEDKQKVLNYLARDHSLHTALIQSGV